MGKKNLNNANISKNIKNADFNKFVEKKLYK